MKQLNRFRVFFAVAALSLASLAQAGGWQSATTISQYTIEGATNGERIYVRFETTFNPDACPGPGVQWVRVNTTTAQGKLFFASILTAKATNQTVTPLISGCDDWGRPMLAGIWAQ